MTPAIRRSRQCFAVADDRREVFFGVHRVVAGVTGTDQRAIFCNRAVHRHKTGQHKVQWIAVGVVIDSRKVGKRRKVLRHLHLQGPDPPQTFGHIGKCVYPVLRKFHRCRQLRRAGFCFELVCRDHCVRWICHVISFPR